ncbi:hypothetical protein [Streptomyces sp. NPDC051572]|uniref:hypothetical protein n=1 Tax=Streptomyces sp. NPDC051572 TaxID=3155802 RepID=UPI00344F41AE
MHTEIDDLDHVLTEIVTVEGAEQGVDLFGWSFGGLVALETAARHTGTVRSRVVTMPGQVHLAHAQDPRALAHHIGQTLRRADCSPRQ